MDTAFKNPAHPSPSAAPLVLGRERFIRFSAVEGIALTPKLDAILSKLDAQGLVGDERQKAIMALVTQDI